MGALFRVSHSGLLVSAPGIPAGLVRMSVGLSGTLEQRWAQLAECFATAARAGPLPFRAAEARAFCSCPLYRTRSLLPCSLPATWRALTKSAYYILHPLS